MQYRNKILVYLISIAALLLISGCTSSRWVVQDQPAVDTSNGTVLSKTETIFINPDLTPSNPVLTLNLMQINKVRYPKRYVVKRYIQRYRPRYGFLILGLTGSAFLFYTANSKTLTTTKSSKNILNIGGGLLGLASFLNMKPAGKAKATGETQFSKKTGSVVRIDTVHHKINSDTKADISIQYKDNTLLKNLSVAFKNGDIDIDLANTVKIGDIKSKNPGDLDVSVEYNKKNYSFKVPLEKFMKRYAVIERPNALLHSNPVNTEANVITNIKYNSQLQFVNQVDSTWYKVLYGITPSYLNSSDAQLVWRTVSSATPPDIVVSPYSKFGTIDVERGIPYDSVKNRYGIALLLNNTFNDDKNDDHKEIYDRDTRLMKTYIEHSMGYTKQNIFTFKSDHKTEFKNVLGLNNIPATITNEITPDSTDLILYYVGDNIQLTNGKKNSDFKQDSVKFVSLYQHLLESVANLKTRKSILIFDTDILQNNSKPFYDDQNKNENSIKKAIFNISQKIVDQNPNMAVVYSSDIGQKAGIYKSSVNSIDKMHSIFTYYFCKGLKEGNRSLLSLSRYLQRNVTFTSRSLLDRAQDPVFFGNLDLLLTSIDNK